MPIVAGDLLFKLSTTAGAAGNTTAQGDPNASFGKYISTTQVSGTALNNLFDDISGAENAASDVEYRCFFLHNNHGSLTYQNAVVYLSGGDPAGGANVAIAVDSTAASAIGSGTAQALEIADEGDSGTVLSGLTFSAPTTAGTGLALGNIGPGQCRAIWVRRSATNSAAVTAETVTLAVSGDTAA